jgi:hypothetical protein
MSCVAFLVPYQKNFGRVNRTRGPADGLVASLVTSYAVISKRNSMNWCDYRASRFITSDDYRAEKLRGPFGLWSPELQCCQ